ncbi:Indigoidine synthase A like protein-domain-containing protein [Pseudomassariella vexata]|uniref:Indigoidine synthase A like protein-domain-containing protein n=1 Tax=Pseudomassariella vexata TaxID=1141098 RepID=A0A1Y2E4X7_9PEZI|nr:Indigoidine synthase A like protein-domain-containing protein [Pseudomassariella vexata]ORY66414.1 Indigoidine synthase A like protein-domain-containing protein [Pseudomassariella vexata]
MRALRRSWALAGALKNLLKVSDEVRDALATNKPVVALESTIYTHGALGNDLDLEGIVRKTGGVPAVVGILDGVPTVGLLPNEVTQMVENSPKKASRRDIAFLVGNGMLGNKMNGGTTIAGTMILARLAGIRVFGTGGLGGVHRGGHNSFDISADLTELGRTRMAVVASGCKGFLDIPRTLEFLETQGVHVSTFADGRRTGNVDFPAFWARESGVKSPAVVQNEEQAAAMIYAQETLGIESAILFANPIPEEFSIPKSEMDAIIEQAVSEAAEQGVLGAENTPFILRRIRELTDGRSVPANKSLVQANVHRATKVAVAVSRAISGDLVASNQSIRGRSCSGKCSRQIIPEDTDHKKQHGEQADIIVAGSVAVDLSCDYVRSHGAGDPSPHLHTSNPAQISQSIGGVGRNVALAAHKVSGDMMVRLCTMVGDDIAGSTVLQSLESAGMDTSSVRRLDRKSSRTAQYVAVNDAEKSLVLAMADMDIFTANSFPAHWNSVVSTARPKLVVVDANWAETDIRSWVKAGKQSGARVVFEPVSTAKSARLFCPSKGHEKLGVFPKPSIDLATPNQYELAAMHAAAKANEYLEDPCWWEIIDAFGLMGARDRFIKLTSAAMTDTGIPQQIMQLLPYIPTLTVKVGSEGALLATILNKEDPRLIDPAQDPFILSRCFSDHPHVGGVYMRLFPSVEHVEDVVSVNGVGDTFLGVMVAGLARGGRVEDLVNVAQKGAVLTLRSSESVTALNTAVNLRTTANAMSSNRADNSTDEESDASLEHYESDGDSSSEDTAPPKRTTRPILEKDSDEEELERLVLGDSANFRQQLFKGDDAESHFGGFGAEGEQDVDSMEDLDDAQLFFLDAPPAASKQLVQGSKSSAPQKDSKNAPAWEDSDDERLTVSLASVPQLRKLRISEAEDVVNGIEYTNRLRQQYLRLNPLPGWAKASEQPPKKRRRRSSGATDDTSDSDSSESGASDGEDEVSALPLDKFLRDARSLKEGKTAKAKKLRPEVINIQRSRDMADSHKDPVTSLSFHPKYPVLLSSSTSSMLFLHHIAPTAHPTPNPLLTSAQIKQVPVRHAEFMDPSGDKIFFAGRRRFIHSWDLPSGLIQKTEKIQGHHLEQRTWERFKLSPCGRYLGLIASTRKGGGIINIINVNTMQWIAAARLDSRGGIADFAWWSNGNGMTILGRSGQVGEWSMASRRFLAIWTDEGSIGGTVMALGGRNGPVLLGTDRWVAIGSKSGVMNVYDRQKLVLPSSDDELVVEEHPEPERRFMQMTTPITLLTFSPDGQILAFGSKHKKDALRLAHLPSCTVYRNWPTEQTPLGRITSLAFGRKSDTLAVGNDGGKIRLWEIRS